MKLTPEDLARIEDKKVANILRKIFTEKRTPTAREEAILLRAGVVQASGNEPATAYVGTWDDLAQHLGVTRRAIQDWRNDPRYKEDLAKRRPLLERADGRHCISEWLRFMVDHGLKRGTAAADATDGPENGDAEGEGIINPPRYGGSQSDWTKAKIAKDVEKKDIEIESIRGTLLEAGDLEIPLGAFLAALQSKLNQFPDMAARRVRGIADEAECRDALRDEIDAIAADLNLARYATGDAIAAAVAGIEQDAEMQALFQKLLFDGADRTALLALACSISTAALRSIGQRAIAKASGEDSSATAAPHPAPETALAAIETSSARAARVPARPATATGKKAASKAKASAAGTSKGRKRKARPQPTPPPPGIEAAIVNTRTKATRRQRR